MRSILAVIALGLLLTACGGSQKQLAQQQATQRWEALVRWSEYDALVDMIHPDWLAENPVEEAEIDRLREFRVTEYRVRQVLTEPDGNGFERLAQIRMYHLRSARERVVAHREVWRYDEDLDRWLLHSGVPDPRE
ncbi:MAG: hypothetical protein ACOCSR_04140 [Wenzhouxiangella sp.]